MIFQVLADHLITPKKNKIKIIQTFLYGHLTYSFNNNKLILDAGMKYILEAKRLERPIFLVENSWSIHNCQCKTCLKFFFFNHYHYYSLLLLLLLLLVVVVVAVVVVVINKHNQKLISMLENQKIYGGFLKLLILWVSLSRTHLQSN